MFHVMFTHWYIVANSDRYCNQLTRDIRYHGMCMYEKFHELFDRFNSF